MRVEGQKVTVVAASANKIEFETVCCSSTRQKKPHWRANLREHGANTIDIRWASVT